MHEKAKKTHFINLLLSPPRTPFWLFHGVESLHSHQQLLITCICMHQVGNFTHTENTKCDHEAPSDLGLTTRLGLKCGLDKVSNLFCTPRSHKCQHAVAVLLPSDLVRGNCFYSVV